MKVIIADLFSPDGIQSLKDAGIEVVYDKDLNADSLKQALIDQAPAALVVRSTKVTADIMESASSLELVIRAGAGVDNIDSAFASQRGIYVTNCPGKNSIAVSELVMGHFVAADRKIVDATNDLHKGIWNKGKYSNGKGLFGRTLGCIGTGFVGWEVIKRAQAFGMNVIAIDPVLSAEKAEAMRVTKTESRAELAAASDFITIHVPFLPATEKMVNAEFLSNCKNDVVIVNSSRGEIVDDEAMLAALNAKPNMWFCGDVYSGEPAAKECEFSHPIAQHAQCYGTPHIGASNKQSEEAIGKEAVRTLVMFNESGAIPMEDCVNLQKKTEASYVLNCRLCGADADVSEICAEMRTRGYKISEMQNTVLLGSVATRASINFKAADESGLEDFKAAMNAKEYFIGLTITKL